MAEDLPHLKLARVERENPRRRRSGRGGSRPDDPERHARELRDDLVAHRDPPEGEVPGFDTRRLLKITILDIAPHELEAIPGLTVVAQEGKDLIVLFATDTALAEFKARLDLIAAGRPAKRTDILFAVKRFENLSPEDRSGPALRTEGEPTGSQFVVDVEFWPLELPTEREDMLKTFRAWCKENASAILDTVNNRAIVLTRVRTTPADLHSMLRMRDVRRVDLPPRFQLDFELMTLDVRDLPPVTPPPDESPVVAVLDTGLSTGHPILGPAVADSRGFVASGGAEDTRGHGTHVASLALYGDVEACLANGDFAPEIRVCSGRILEDDPESNELLENIVAKAVAEFRSEYDCRVFNLSIGDERKPYTDGHVDRLAATLDTLARERDVLFVVSAGNFGGSSDGPVNWREEYPSYLLEDNARIIDPAPALNVLTVGSLARLERSRQAARSPKDPAFQPLARKNEPSPFSRSGPGPGNAIKPEVVHYGGNFFVDIRTGLSSFGPDRSLGELGASSRFAGGKLLAVEVGTSFAAPKVANLAARILVRYPEISLNLVRALIVAHAEVPEEALRCVGDSEKLLRLVGYGLPGDDASRYSGERRVTLIAEESIAADQHHFYEVPLPEDFLRAPARRRRRISVALAHTPHVRRSRLEYRESALSFRIVRREKLDEVVRAFRQLKKGEQEPAIGEKGYFPGPNARNGGTVQCARKVYKAMDRRQRDRGLFVVVTRRLPGWMSSGGLEETEPYALAVVLEDLSGEEVQLYTQIRTTLRARERERARA